MSGSIPTPGDQPESAVDGLQTSPPGPADQAERVHSDNKQILVRMAEGMEFKAAITHTEKDGEHQVVVASAEVHLPLLRLCSPAMMKMLSEKFGVPLDKLSYFERGGEGALFRVDPEKIGSQQGDRGHWTDEQQALARQHPAGLPKVDPDTSEPDIDLSRETLPHTPDLRAQALTDLRRARFHRYKL